MPLVLPWTLSSVALAGDPDIATCFPISATVADCLAGNLVSGDTAFVVEEASICAHHAPIPAVCQVVVHEIPQDAGVDWSGTVDHLAELDPAAAEHFASLKAQPAVPLPVWDAAKIQRVLQEIVDAVRKEVPDLGPVTITPYERGFRIVASPEHLLEQVVDLDPKLCPEAVADAGSGTWRVSDAERCALARFADRGIRVDYNPNFAGAYWATGQADDRVWHDTVLWQVLDEMYRGYGQGQKGFVLTIEDQPHPGMRPGQVPTRRSVTVRTIAAPPPMDRVAPL